MAIYKQLELLDINGNAQAIIDFFLENKYSFGALNQVTTENKIKEANLQLEYSFTNTMVVVDCIGGFASVFKDNKNGQGYIQLTAWSKCNPESLYDFISNLKKNK